MLNSRTVQTFRNIVLTLAVAITIIPFLWTVTTAFKFPRDILRAEILFEPTWQNFLRVFGSGSNIPRLFFNSTVIALTTVLISVVAGFLSAYSLSRWRFPGNLGKHILYLLLFVRMIFPVALAIPYYVLMHRIGLHNTVFALIIVHTAVNIPFGVWLLKTFLDEFPLSIEEAARVDGCSTLGTLVRIVLPLLGPGVAATSIFIFILSWNDYLFASVLTASSRAMTVPIGLANYVQENIILWGPMSAGASVFTVPVFIFAFLVQNHLIKGFTLGTFKG